MIASASTRTPSRRTSTFPSALALRSMSSTAILSSAIVISLRVVGSSVQRREDDAMADSFVSRFGCYTIIRDTTVMAERSSSPHPTQRRYPPELRERAVRLVREVATEQGERHGAVTRVAKSLGIGSESVRLWVRQAEINDGERT